MFGDQPAAIHGPHLDYRQNDMGRRAFHDVHSPARSKESTLLFSARIAVESV